jgi:hypothetical protein
MPENNNIPRVDGVRLTAEATAVHIQNIHDDIAEIKAQIPKNLKTVTDHISGMESQYVKREEFSPVRSIAYGLVGLIMIGVISGVLALLIRTGASAVAGQ